MSESLRCCVCKGKVGFAVNVCLPCASKLGELGTSTQQIKAEIAALESRLRMVGCVSAEDTEELCSIREEMRQLSAV